MYINFSKKEMFKNPKIKHDCVAFQYNIKGHVSKKSYDKSLSYLLSFNIGVTSKICHKIRFETGPWIALDYSFKLHPVTHQY